MKSFKKHKLIETEWPAFGPAEVPPPAGLEEFEQRLRNVRSRMEARSLSHLIVYADREHFANLAYLTNFDPRYEEALLILNLKDSPLLLVGNECVARLPVSPLFNQGTLRHERFQPFSLLDQPRRNSRLLKDILTGEGLGPGARAGCVGWKYLTEIEHPDPTHAIEIPAYIVDALRELAGREKIVNATEILMHPEAGLRALCSPSEIAFFEFSNVIASEGMKNLLFGIEDGKTDFDMAKEYGYNGMPLNCHIGMNTGRGDRVGLSSPTGKVLRRGEPFSTNLGYWGSNICRSGWIAESAKDLPLEAQDYVENFAGPYFETMGEWFGMLKIGTPGGRLEALISERLPFEKFGIFLNPGHLIHLDEWLSSPIYKDSRIELRSGMVLQVDVIPSSKIYFSTRMEDGIALADKSLRREIETRFPKCYERCQKRRRFMREVLGIDLPEEVLPLSNIPALVPPFFLRPQRVFALDH
jgi:hypothetical protein